MPPYPPTHTVRPPVRLQMGATGHGWRSCMYDSSSASSSTVRQSLAGSIARTLPRIVSVSLSITWAPTSSVKLKFRAAAALTATLRSQKRSEVN